MHFFLRKGFFISWSHGRQYPRLCLLNGRRQDRPPHGAVWQCGPADSSMRLAHRSRKKIGAPDPVQSAALAKLQYVAETGPGIIRKRAGAGFRYFDADGKPVRNKKDLARIAALA